MAIKMILLDILACPACHGCLQEKNSLISCSECGVKYKIEAGIPILITKEQHDTAKL